MISEVFIDEEEDEEFQEIRPENMTEISNNIPERYQRRDHEARTKSVNQRSELRDPEGRTKSVKPELEFMNRFANNVLLIGDEGVGKTTLSKYLSRKIIDDKKLSLPTIGIDYKYFSIRHNRRTYQYIIRDVSGNDRYEWVPKLFLYKTDILVFMFNVKNIDSFFKIKKIYQGVVDQIDINIKILLIGHLFLEDQGERVISSEEARIYAKYIDAIYVEIDVYKKLNIHLLEQAFINFSQKTYIDRGCKCVIS